MNSKIQMNISLDSLKASSADDLLHKIASRNVSVPPRGFGQTKGYREIWVAFRFLRTTGSSPLLSYPLRVEFSDKPDLILEFEGGKPKSIGIEITEAISPNAAKLQVELERDGMAGFYSVPEHKYFDSRQDLEKQRKIVRGEAPSPPIMGDAIEQNWYDAILRVICTKSTKFKHSDFRCYPENWLLIYDNWSPHIPDSEVDAMIIKINQYLSESSWRHPFDRIFIQSSERMWKLS